MSDDIPPLFAPQLMSSSTQKELDNQKRANHNELERRRRENLGQEMNNLGKKVFKKFSQSSSSKSKKQKGYYIECDIIIN